MTKKDYIAIANALKASRPHVLQTQECVQFRETVAHVVAMLVNDNPRFDRNRFIDTVYDGIDTGSNSQAFFKPSRMSLV